MIDYFDHIYLLGFAKKTYGAWNLIRDGLTLKTCYLESNMIEEGL